MDKSFQAGWDCALGAVLKRVKNMTLLNDFDDEACKVFGWDQIAVRAASEIRENIASLKCGAGNEPNPELVNALRAYMSQSETLDRRSVASSTHEETWLARLRRLQVGLSRAMRRAEQQEMRQMGPDVDVDVPRKFGASDELRQQLQVDEAARRRPTLGVDTVPASR